MDLKRTNHLLVKVKPENTETIKAAGKKGLKRLAKLAEKKRIEEARREEERRRMQVCSRQKSGTWVVQKKVPVSHGHEPLKVIRITFTKM